MLKHHNQIIITIVAISDLILAFCSWELAYFSRFFWLPFFTPEVIPLHYQYFKAVPVLIVLTGIIFASSGVYQPQRIARLFSEIFHIFKACLWLFITILALAFFYRKFSYSRIQMVYFIGMFPTLLLLSRCAIYGILRILHSKGVHVQNILVIGTSKVAANFIRALSHYPNTGLDLMGVIQMPDSPISEKINSVPILGKINDIKEAISKYEVDQVFIALSALEHIYLPQLREALAEQIVDIKIIPDLGTFHPLRPDVENFEGVPIVTVTQSPMRGWNLVLKRLFDFWGALFCLIVFSPIMILITILVKITSSGPIFYSQERMGLDGVTFQTLKFRSMRIDAENQTGAVWAKKGDDRCTPIGSFIRKTSLDELPQLFNVLVGHMSLVGPRPERPVFIKDFKKQIPNYMLRHKVKAGITGWAQINGWRGNTSLEKRIEFDLFYIENWSLWFDIKILFLTIFKGFIDPNAY